MKKAVVVIPTYNESASIGALLLHLVEHTFPTTDWACEVLVVDANSPDGTAQLVRQIQESHPEIHLLVEEKKEGLGAAYFKGFQHAVSVLGADVLVEFDGDFQHPPETIPVLLKAIDDGSDLVLGSRWRRGGGYPRKWGFFRLFLSVVGGFVARLLLFFPTRAFWAVTDPTTGLKATRVKGPYQSLDFERFASRDFGYKIEMLFHLVRAGARVAEVPLRFQTRDEGESKMTGQTPFDVFRAVFLLRWRDKPTRRFLKFASVGLSGFVVNSIMLEVFVRTAIGPALAQPFQNLADDPLWGFLSQPAAWAAALAVECSILNNFLWNNGWTFRHHRSSEFVRLLGRFLKFNALSLGAVLVQFLTMGIATHWLGNTLLVRQLTMVLTIGAVVVPMNWFLYSHVIWHRDPKDKTRA